MKMMTTGIWLGLCVMGCSVTQASVPEQQLVLGISPFMDPYLDGSESIAAPRRRAERINQFKRLFGLMLVDRRIESWPGKRMSDCVQPLMGIWGDGVWSPGWTERCESMVGESQAYFYFANNPYLRTETIQRMEIVLPSSGWLMKKEILSHLDQILGRSVLVAVKDGPKKSLRWQWKIGKGKAVLIEEKSSGARQSVMRFVWVRPPQEPNATLAQLLRKSSAS